MVCRERFGAGSIYIPYSIKSQLELQSEFPNHMIAIDSHCASVKKKTVAIQVTKELFFLLLRLRPFWPFGICVPKKFISLFSVQGASAASGSSTRPKRKCLWLCTENIHWTSFQMAGECPAICWVETLQWKHQSGWLFWMFIPHIHMNTSFYKYIIMRNTLQLKPVNLMFRLRHTQIKSIL